MTTTDREQNIKNNRASKSDAIWLVYISILLSGLILLTYSFGYTPIMKVPARLGLAMVYSAIALLIGRNRTSGMIAAAIIWLTIILTFFI